MRTSLPGRRKIACKATKVVSDIDVAAVCLAVRRESENINKERSFNNA